MKITMLIHEWSSIASITLCHTKHWTQNLGLFKEHLKNEQELDYRILNSMHWNRKFYFRGAGGHTHNKGPNTQNEPSMGSWSGGQGLPVQS